MTLKRPEILLLNCVALGVLASCTPLKMQKAADREVYGILGNKSSKVENSGEDFMDVTPKGLADLSKLADNKNQDDFLGERAHVESKAKMVPLQEALQMALHHNREYQSRKELLYLDALSLTQDRHDFTPILSASTGSQLVSNSSSTVRNGVSTLVTDNTLSSDGRIGASLLGKAGTRIATNFTTDFLKFMTGNLSNVSDSSLAVTLSQPLLRGAGQRSTTEYLTQAERDLMYAIRDFTQYRKTFIVDVATKYLQTVQAREVAKNAHAAFKSFEKILVAERELTRENRRTISQLGLIEQASLRYERLWINAVRNYEQQLDAFKILIGAPVLSSLVLNADELQSLKMESPPLTLEDSLSTAMQTRLDLYNSRDSVEDAERKILIAQQNLLPQLDLSAGYNVQSDPGRNSPSLNFNRDRLSAGLDLDLRLDKKADRNSLRSAQIAQQRAERQLDLDEENVRSILRTDWREIAMAAKQYEIADSGVKLSSTRLEREQLLNELGQGTARDLIDAQQDLIEAKDDLNAALINHHLSTLRLYRDMGVLHIKKDGSWENVLKKEGFVSND